MDTQIDIIGAGIGGLTAGIVLLKRGYKINIFESTQELKPVGAGIILANNAMQVLKMLGLEVQLKQAGNSISFMKVTDQRLKPLSIVDLSVFEQKYNVANLAIHRGELQKILLEEVGGDNVFANKRLSNLIPGDPVTLMFQDGSIKKSNIVIGADGIHSIVRNHIVKNSIIRKANQWCWRGVCDFELPEKYHRELNEAWGKGKRFGFVKIGHGRVYWYALVNGKAEISKEVILENFIEFHPVISDIINSTKVNNIILNEIIDLKPIESWVNGNICLIGDAAHAMTPNMGQGACQAIEDAYMLGKCLDKKNVVDAAFIDYEQSRIKKARQIVHTSWSIGKMAHLENSLAVWMRDAFMKLTPQSINRKQMEGIFEIDVMKF